jgi:hypothetical protein
VIFTREADFWRNNLRERDFITGVLICGDFSAESVTELSLDVSAGVDTGEEVLALVIALIGNIGGKRAKESVNKTLPEFVAMFARGADRFLFKEGLS